MVIAGNGLLPLEMFIPLKDVPALAKDQVNVDPLNELVKFIGELAIPSQRVWFSGELVIDGVGNNVIPKEAGVPKQVLKTGVTVTVEVMEAVELFTGAVHEESCPFPL